MAVFSYDCNGSAAQKWLINAGQTAVQVAGTNYCLDAGDSKSFRLCEFLPMFLTSFHQTSETVFS